MPVFDHYAQGVPCYIELTTPDPDDAATFYVRLLDWSTVDVDMGDGVTYTPATLEELAVAGIMRQPTEWSGLPASWGVYLAVDELDPLLDRVPELGGEVNAGPFDIGDLGRTAMITDPSGARVALWQAGTSPGTVIANEPGAPVWNELVTTDVDAATAFYVDLLGVAWTSVPMGEGSYLSMAVDGRTVAGVVPQTEGLPSRWTVYFQVVDVDAATAHAVDLGGLVVEAPDNLAGVGRVATLADPQGATFHIMRD